MLTARNVLSSKPDNGHGPNVDAKTLGHANIIDTIADVHVWPPGSILNKSSPRNVENIKDEHELERKRASIHAERFEAIFLLATGLRSHGQPGA